MGCEILNRAMALALLLSAGNVASGQLSSNPKPLAYQGPRMLTGCLRTSDDEYVLAVKDGVMWELSGDSSKFDEDIGHTVTITGIASHAVIRKTKKAEKDQTTKYSTHHNRSFYSEITVVSVKVNSKSCRR